MVIRVRPQYLIVQQGYLNAHLSAGRETFPSKNSGRQCQTKLDRERFDWIAKRKNMLGE